ncbi:MAG: hypothetical protein RBU21_16590 [FCB group bacterium]|jgi:hypothetical protein|nr:hypothetical protein [FCB group bacterium]
MTITSTITSTKRTDYEHDYEHEHEWDVVWGRVGVKWLVMGGVIGYYPGFGGANRAAAHHQSSFPAQCESILFRKEIPMPAFLRLGTFRWPELCSGDAAASKAYYRGVSGCQAHDKAMPEEATFAVIQPIP